MRAGACSILQCYSNKYPHLYNKYNMRMRHNKTDTHNKFAIGNVWPVSKKNYINKTSLHAFPNCFAHIAKINSTV